MMAGQVIYHLVRAKGVTGKDDVRIALPLRKGQIGVDVLEKGTLPTISVRKRSFL